MGKAAKQLILAGLFGLIFPSFMMATLIPPKEPVTQETTCATTPEPIQPAIEPEISVLTDGGEVIHLSLEEYVLGVLLQEVPASFETEALKAQAIATRTYTLRRYEGSFKHENAIICTDPSCCQAYRSATEFLTDGGREDALDHVRQAVWETAGQVLYYDGTLIEATYFSCSGGMTESAVAVWGEDIPYLQATESPGEEAATHHTDAVTFTREVLAQKLNVLLTGNPENWVWDVHYTDGGGVERLTLCGKVFTGTQLRSLLNLRSTAFDTEPVENGLQFITRGFGHRVGMSQYGAQAMAQQGMDHRQILNHYYANTQLETYRYSSS